jgi:hypothetical protein
MSAGASPKLLSFTAFCPTQRETVHIPFYDCIKIHWGEKVIQFYCLACKDNHHVPIGGTNADADRR